MTETGTSIGSTPPRVLTYIAALACGLFLALSAHIGLTAAGVGLHGAAREAFFSGKDQINPALAWWAIGIAGCFGSLAAIVLARGLNRPGLRIVRIAAGLVFLCVLAAAGRKAGAPADSPATMTMAVNLAAVALGAFMAFFSAHFAARR